eukprot:Gb_33191 [translate_table: standard]
MIRTGIELDNSVQSSLISMYAKCESMECARQVFDKMFERYVVSWSAMIAGYKQNGHDDEALTLFRKMQLHNVKPDLVVMVSILPACAHLLSALQQGKLIHGYIIRTGFDSEVAVGTSLIDIAMIAGYGMHGHGEDPLALFSQMQLNGVKPNHITFVSVLCTCHHEGLVEEVWHWFSCMVQNYDIMPKLEHYGCMVDLLGCSGHLDEAYCIIKEMPMEPDVSMWGALLSACRIHHNIAIGEHAAERLFELDPESAGYHVQLVHAFLVGDKVHLQSEKIYAMLATLSDQIKEAGYLSNTNFVLHDVEEELKEQIRCSHSEKLAIAFGLLNTNPGTPIQIMKNLRICGDCHSATKFISRIVQREIIVRNAHRFHHFKDALCSCGDYW